VNPKPFLADLTGKIVRVRLKWGMEYQGRLASSDAYMNLQLHQTEEFIDGELAGFLGEVLIRCNNVLYIKAAENQDEEEDEDGDTGGGARRTGDTTMRD
jgi:small nuclear ribonucleoprotein F